jgi:DNA polymerase III epsilon subunit-like protein
MSISFYNIVNSCDIKLQNNMVELKNSIKKLSKFIDINQNKDELIKIAIGLNNYKKNQNTNKNDKFIFRDKEVKLNDEQKEIVFDDSNFHIRIIAGAGSGKTTTILCRIKYLLDNFTTPDKILILTFNRNNCEDIKTKIKNLFGFEMRMDICTIDKFCNILKFRYSYDDNDKIKNTTKLYSLTELCVIGEELMNKYGKEISSQYEYVFFDEFQDVNQQQFNILKIFVDNGCILNVIGDDNQNIYQFRGTDNYYIIHFDKFIKNTKTFHLTTNYRSSREIVNLANKSIENNKHKILKNMKAIKNLDKLPQLYLLKNTESQCQFIFEKIKKQIKKYKLKYDDFAILCRNGFPLKDFETYFTKNKIPCVTLLSNKNYDYNNKVSVLKNHLTISTIHSAKGLEWYTVFIVGLCDEHFPSHVNNNIKNIEEERRLFYVGVTRAKNNLYFVASKKDLPLTRFIQEIDNKEIFEHINKVNHTDIYGVNDNNFAVNSYGVTDIIMSLSGNEMSNMKNEKIIFDEINNNDIEDLYTEKLLFNENISNKYLEADFGLFCDYVLTRKIMINSKQEIKDEYALWIINGCELEDNEMEIYNMYNLQKYHCYNDKILKECDTSDIIKEKHKSVIKDLFNRINPKYEVRRKNTYPSIFLDQLKKSYINYCNSKLDNNEILRDIYYVSLSNKIKSNRRRLIYMDVFDIFMDGFDKINMRINDYADKIKNNNNVCKSYFSYNYNDIECSLCGELDLLDVTEKNNHKIIDFKCSNDDFKLEWIIQLLLYYCLYTEKKNKYVKTLSIFNIMNGKYYNFSIPDNYDYKKLLKFMEKVIKDVSLSNRYIMMPSYDYELIKDKNTSEQIIIKKECNLELNLDVLKKNTDAKNTIVLDVETNCEKGQIIQLSYMIFDEKCHLIKTVNKYIKDRIVSVRSFEVNKITNSMLKFNGESFNKVISEFISDLSSCNVIVGHNIDSDCRVINKNYMPHHDLFENKHIYCTMKNGKYICDLKNINGKIKNPKLEELYFRLFKKIPKNCHDSMKDVEYTAECYFYMRYSYQELLEIVKNMDNFCKIVFETLGKKAEL